jgi:hypothetical protein
MKFLVLWHFDLTRLAPEVARAVMRIGSLGFCRTTGTGCVGAMLYRGFQSSSHGAVSKCSSSICFRRESR